MPKKLCRGATTNLTIANLSVCPRGMTAFFNKLRRAKLELKEEGELVSDAYLLRTAWNKIRGKHDMLDDAISKLRTQAGISGIPTTFARARNVLTDIFDFEVSMSAKTEKPLVPANYAFTGKKRKGDDDKDKRRKRQRRQFPKGSCKDCPEATDHTTKFCYKKKRKEMGLPNGFKWCSFHTTGCHYEHLCKRHAPNYPPVPTVIGANAAHFPTTREIELRKQIEAMIANAKSRAATQPAV